MTNESGPLHHTEEQGSYGTLQKPEDQGSLSAQEKGSIGGQENGAPHTYTEDKPENAGWNWKEELLFLTLLASSLFTYMTFSLMGPLFPAEAEAKGVSYTVQGWIFAVYALTQVRSISSLSLERTVSM